LEFTAKEFSDRRIMAAEGKVDKATLMRSLPQILRVLPSEWMGTTFANDALLGFTRAMQEEKERKKLRA